ncbi:hypothetical protein RHSIM_Rhsim07G0054500 [Rhododendron simsii]|uniref:Zinc finger A20 and AN1 domain-containing stress-associated protein 5 n=1 Tax=Rhododendron simsii TaxID=118357 RepID=A0A834GMP9_RHOSS|nr:hypothetical protein RHSIM_Rhsim07G0054500 [Rhododendron simsii]
MPDTRLHERTEKEETEFKVVPDSTTTATTIILCVNNCGVIANPKTNNMCQNCFNSTTSSSSASVIVTSQKPRSISSRSPKRSSSPAEAVQIPTAQDPTEGSKREVNRCSGCHRKVGLTGFRCRCGDLFCADHRYSDRHDCSYDYKAAGREAIARENPVVKAAKIVRV